MGATRRSSNYIRSCLAAVGFSIGSIRFGSSFLGQLTRVLTGQAFISSAGYGCIYQHLGKPVETNEEFALRRLAWAARQFETAGIVPAASRLRFQARLILSHRSAGSMRLDLLLPLDAGDRPLTIGIGFDQAGIHGEALTTDQARLDAREGSSCDAVRPYEYVHLHTATAATRLPPDASYCRSAADRVVEFRPFAATRTAARSGFKRVGIIDRHMSRQRRQRVHPRWNASPTSPPPPRRGA
jgi:hypothetical protein